MDDAKLIKIRVTAQAKKILEQAAEETGMKQEAVASRIFMWWAHQPKSTREVILGMLPIEAAKDIAKLVAEHLSQTVRQQNKSKN